MKKIWILNHYAANMYLNRNGRHYNFSKYLIKEGYKPLIFCASTVHKHNKNLIEDDRLYYTDEIDGIKFVFVKTRGYAGNNKDRVFNMTDFYSNVKRVAGILAKQEMPDIILASSVHPLTCLAGLKIAKKFKIPCIIEIRDLWPETLIALGALKPNGLTAKILYAFEKYLYKKADSIIFTMEGGMQYIKDKGWGKAIAAEKVYYINNGVDIEKFRENERIYQLDDSDLTNEAAIKIAYTGTIAKVNSLNKILGVAEMLQSKYNDKIQFLLYGEGDERKKLEKYCSDKAIKNIKFKGWAKNCYIPYILVKCNAAILTDAYSEAGNTPLRYGTSINKTFEYMAAGIPILHYSALAGVKYNPLIRYDSYVEVTTENALLQAIEDFYRTYQKPECNANNRTASYYAEEFDFANLTQKLIKVIENTK